MKDNKALVILVFILAVALIGETAYLINLKKKDVSKNVFSKQRLADQEFKKAKRGLDKQLPCLNAAPRMAESANPFKEMERMQREMDRMFQDSYVYPQPRMSVNFGAGNRFLNPQTDIKKTEAAYIIQMDVPGMKKDEINIDIQGNMMTISGQRKYEASREEKDAGFVNQSQEREFGFFSRSIPLPPDVKKEEIKAGCENGVLFVTLPRVAAEKPGAEQPTKIKIE